MLSQLFHDIQGPLCSILSYIPIYELTTNTWFACRDFYRSSRYAVLRLESGYSHQECVDMFFSKGVPESLLSHIVKNSKSFDTNVKIQVRMGTIRFPMDILIFCRVRNYTDVEKHLFEKHEKGSTYPNNPQVPPTPFKIPENEEQLAFSKLFRTTMGAVKANNLALFKMIVHKKEVGKMWMFGDFLILKQICREGHYELAKYLLKHSVLKDVDTISSSCIFIACKYNNPELLKLLMDTGKCNATYNNNWALKTCAQMGNTDALKILLTDTSVDPSDQDNFALRRSVKYGKFEAFEYLFTHERIQRNKHLHNDLFELAIQNWRVEIIAYLLDNSDVNPLDYLILLTRGKSRKRCPYEIILLIFDHMRNDPKYEFVFKKAFGSNVIKSIQYWQEIKEYTILHRHEKQERLNAEENWTFLKEYIDRDVGEKREGTPKEELNIIKMFFRWQENGGERGNDELSPVEEKIFKNWKYYKHKTLQIDSFVLNSVLEKKSNHRNMSDGGGGRKKKGNSNSEEGENIGLIKRFASERERVFKFWTVIQKYVKEVAKKNENGEKNRLLEYITSKRKQIAEMTNAKDWGDYRSGNRKKDFEILEF